MEKIKIGETVMTAGVRCSGGTLSLTFPKARIEEIAGLLAETNAQEIRELTASGATRAIYQNHALTRVYTETIAGTTYVHATLAAQVMETSETEALRAELARMGEKIDGLLADTALLREKVGALLVSCGLGAL